MDAPLFPPGDFIEYWAAARLHLSGGNPYDGAELLPLQNAAWPDPNRTTAVMLWTPPWTLPLYWPFGALGVGAGHAAWVAVQVLAVLASAGLAWRAGGGPGRWGLLLPLAVAAAFAPTWWMVAYGQNTGFVALGAAGFVWAQARGRPRAAGAFAALTAIKPHLLALLGLALVLDGLSRRGRPALLTGVGVLALLGVGALVPDPAVYRQFADALTGPATAEKVPLSYWYVPTVGYRLRDWAAGGLTVANAGDRFWVQFVPLAVGLALFPAYWLKRRAAWDWPTEAPRLVLASVLVAPYGAWIFDLTVLLVPVAAVAGRLTAAGRWVPLVALGGGLVLLSVETLDARLVTRLGDTVWFAPGVLAAVTGAVWLGRPPVPPPRQVK